jgi:hypothetical protein
MPMNIVSIAPKVAYNLLKGCPRPRLLSKLWAMLEEFGQFSAAARMGERNSQSEAFGFVATFATSAIWHWNSALLKNRYKRSHRELWFL